MIHVVPAKAAHCRAIARDIRPRDKDELALGWQLDPMEVMARGLKWSVKAITILNGIKPFCICGIAPMELLTSRYMFWIVPTMEIDRHPFAFARASRRWLPYLIKDCDTVTNIVDSEDKSALKWATWLGCEMRPYADPSLPPGRFLQFFAKGKGKRCPPVSVSQAV